MKDRAKFFVVALFLSLIFSVGAVCAQEDMSFEQSNVEVPVGTVDVDPDENNEDISLNQEDNEDNDVLKANNEPAVKQRNHTVDGNTFKDIENVISGAGDGDIIFLGGKNYTGTSQIRITKSVTIVGGFSLGDGKYSTLNAQSQSRIFYIDKEDVTVYGINFINGHSDNNNGVAVAWIGANGVLSDCSFVSNSAGKNGGAVWWNGANGVLSDCSFVSNSAGLYGGAVWWSSANGVLSDCSFVSNSAGKNGGAVWWSSDNGVLSDCSFENNSASGGGAVDWSGAAGVLSDCSFVSNSASYSGAVDWSGAAGVLGNCSFVSNSANRDGGAMYDGFAVNCTFIGNIARENGGAMYDGSAVNCNFTNNTAIKGNGGAISDGGATNCTFIGNTANLGGAIYGMSGATNCTFIGNTAQEGGGAMAGFAAAFNCTFIGNSAQEYGGGAMLGPVFAFNSTFINNSANNGGAVVLLMVGSFINCTFENNHANGIGGAVYWMVDDEVVPRGNLTNCSFIGNSAVCGSALHITGSASILDSRFFNNRANSTSLELIVNLTGNNVAAKSVLTGGDNLLNGIYTETNNVSLVNVSYLGFNGLMNTGDDLVNPVSSADLSDDGTLVYMDSREAGQNITIEIYRNGIFYDEYTLSSDIYGAVSVDFTDLKPGNYTVKSCLRKNSYYTLINSSESFFTIYSVASFILVDGEFDLLATDFNAGERGNKIYATLIDEYGEVLANKTIQIAINGVIYKVLTDSNGVAGIQINLGSANTYTCAWFFQGDELYNASLLASSKIVITKKPITISASNCVFKASAKTKTVTAKISTAPNPHDGKTYLAKNKLVTLTLNGRIYNGRTDENGVAKFNIQVTKKGTYSAVIKFAGDRTYEAASKTIKITLDDKGASSSQKFGVKAEVLGSSGKVSVIPTSNLDIDKNACVIDVAKEFTRVACDYGAGERGDYFYAVLKDSNGTLLVNKTVQIAVNGPIYNFTSDENGTVGIMVNLASANTYTYALAFSGDEDCNAAPLACSKLIVTKKPITIAAKDCSFKADAKTKIVTATLSTSKNPYDGKTYLSSGKKVTLKVNGNTYSGTIDASGKVTFNVKLTKKGTYNAVISFSGDQTYEAAEKTIKITIKG